MEFNYGEGGKVVLGGYGVRGGREEKKTLISESSQTGHSRTLSTKKESEDTKKQFYNGKTKMGSIRGKLKVTEREQTLPPHNLP